MNIKEEIRNRIIEISESGTSEGVKKGWESRRKGGGSAGIPFKRKTISNEFTAFKLKLKAKRRAEKASFVHLFGKNYWRPKK